MSGSKEVSICLQGVIQGLREPVGSPLLKGAGSMPVLNIALDMMRKGYIALDM